MDARARVNAGADEKAEKTTLLNQKITSGRVVGSAAVGGTVGMPSEGGAWPTFKKKVSFPGQSQSGQQEELVRMLLELGFEVDRSDGDSAGFASEVARTGRERGTDRARADTRRALRRRTRALAQDKGISLSVSDSVP